MLKINDFIAWNFKKKTKPAPPQLKKVEILINMTCQYRKITLDLKWTVEKLGKRNLAKDRYSVKKRGWLQAKGSFTISSFNNTNYPKFRRLIM